MSLAISVEDQIGSEWLGDSSGICTCRFVYELAAAISDAACPRIDEMNAFCVIIGASFIPIVCHAIEQ